MPVEEETVLEETFEPEDATSDTFLEDARRAVLEEAGFVEDSQENVEEETVTNESELVPEKVEDSELDKPFIGSRREAYRLAEERAVALKESETKNAQLQEQLANQAKLDEELAKDVLAALSTDEEYKNLEYRSRAGDTQAGALLEQIDANRAFFGKLQAKASRDISSYFTSKIVEASKEAGLPEDLVFKGSPAEIVKSAFEAGLAKAKSDAQATIESLEAEVKSAKASRVTRRAGNTLSGGNPTHTDTMGDLFGPDGLPTEEMIAAAKGGRLRALN